MALFDEGYLLGAPQVLDGVDLVTLVVVHHALEQRKDCFALDAAAVRVAVLEHVEQPWASIVALKQPLELLRGQVELLLSAQVELVEVGYQLTDILGVLVQMLVKAEKLLVDAIKLHLCPTITLGTRGLFHKGYGLHNWDVIGVTTNSIWCNNLWTLSHHREHALLVRTSPRLSRVCSSMP